MASNGAGAVGTGTVEIVEVGPRDGLQNEAALLPTEAKLELIRRALSAGVRRIEAVSFVHPRLVPQMADAEAVMDGVRADGFLPAGVAPGDVRFIGLVLNPRGLARALTAGVDEVNVVVAASEGFAHANQNSTVDALIEAAGEIAEQARAAGVPASVVISTAFGCPFDGEVAPDAVLAVARRLIDAGFEELAVADTIGVGVPAQVRELVTRIAAVAGGVRLRAHFHNTRNTGYANALAAVEAGVGVLDASVGGIGGCPFAPNATGNIATEDLVYLLHRSGYRTGLDLAGLADTGLWVGDQLGRHAPALLGRAGPFPSRKVPA
ncbi:MAG TPA: hydroxymethylglutaryl-CoA lyase [Kineosporiaceae bacterium]|nr:hydroxymethylglutaryl-CoA lyase [Kineosporiaceae bacterium]